MTITGIDTTGASVGGTAPQPRDGSAVEDLDAELRSLSTAADRTATAAPPAPRVDPEPQVSRPGWRSLTRGDVAALVSMVAMALFLVAPLWLDLDRELREDPQDQAFFEWMLAHGARVLTDGVSPFFSDRLNYPDGVNMMANTSVLAISLPLTPVTLLFGPHVAFNVFLTLALAVTGISWYLVLSRKFVTSRTAAWVGAIFATFAPSMVSHAGGHPNIVTQFLVPVLIWRTMELRTPGRAVRNGLILAGVVVWQAFINLEVLFMTAVGVGIFCGVLAIARRRDSVERATFLKGLGVTAVVALAALAYPLYVQFFGPQAYHGLSEFVRYFGADLGSFTGYARRSIAGDDATASRLAQNAAEENAFFGWGLVILFFGLAVWMRRNLAVVTMAGIAVFFAAMSLGPQVYLNGKPTQVAGLWAYLHSVPVLNSAVPTRWAMAIAPVIAIVLALGCQRAVDLGRRQPAARGPLRVAIAIAVGMALVPLFPTPLLTRPMSPVPAFVTSGQWRTYIDEQHSLVALPLPNSAHPSALRWAAYTGNDMRIARGYGLFPAENPLDPADRTGQFEAAWRPTSGLFASIAAGYPTPQLTDARREMTLADLRYWKAGAVILTPQDRDVEMLRAMSGILGFQPTWTGGAWVWDVRALVDDPGATLIQAAK